jgi:hypothetical protein
MKPVIDQKNELLPYAAQVRPLAVIVLIFDKVPLQSINSAMASLLKAAMPYCGTAKERVQFKGFHKWQGLLLQSLFTIYNDKNLPANKPNNELKRLQMAYRRHIARKRIPNYVMQDPTLILRQLLKACPASYARVRLWDWMDRGLSNKHVYRSNADRYDIYYYYQLCAGLIAAAASLDNPNID